jgi:hypothetical protein
MKDEAKARRARRTVGIGLLLIVVFGLLVLSPLLMGRGSINRYLVAFGLIGVLLGASFLLHGGWDWVRSR